MHFNNNLSSIKPPSPPEATGRLWRLLRAVGLALSFLCLTIFALLHLQPISQAQGGGVTLTKTLNNSSAVVRVGQVVSFTVALTNNASFTLTNVTLLDQYNQNVLAFAGANPPPNLHNPATGTIAWTNVAAPPIAPGQTLTFTLFFTAEHPQTTVVNFARAQDITGTGSAISDTQASDQIDEAVGGSAPLFKQISPPGSTLKTGDPVTFTQIITNEGAALITFLPLTDTYDPAFLQFNFAIPTPSITSPPGLLVWTDLTTHFGSIGPMQTVVVTTVFTATGQGGSTSNQASIQGARDEYNNDLAAGQALVPITIIGDTPAPAPTDNSGPDDDKEEETLAPTATPTVQATVSATLTGQSVISESNAPRFLPETGEWPGNQPFPVVEAGLVLLVALILFWLNARETKKRS